MWFFGSSILRTNDAFSLLVFWKRNKVSLGCTVYHLAYICNTDPENHKTVWSALQPQSYIHGARLYFSFFVSHLSSTVCQISQRRHFQLKLSRFSVSSLTVYCDTLFYPLPDFLVKRLQCVQFAVASFVEGRYVNDVSKIRRMGWLPVKEGRDFHLLNLVHKALYSPNWPIYV